MANQTMDRAHGPANSDIGNCYGPELPASVQAATWQTYHTTRIHLWDLLGAAVEAGALVLVSALSDRKWAEMYSNAGLGHWRDQLSDAGRAVADQCVGVLEYVRITGGDDLSPELAERIAAEGWAEIGRIDEGTHPDVPGCYSALVTARNAFFCSVARLAHMWVWQRSSLHATAADSHQEAVLECLAAIESWWPTQGTFSTWLFSRLRGVYTNRLRVARRTPTPSLALSLPAEAAAGVMQHSGGSAMDMEMIRSGAGAENPWVSADVHLDVGRVVLSGAGELDGATVAIHVCKAHRAALVKGHWRRRVLEPQPLTCECDVCHRQDSAPVRAMVAAGMLEPSHMVAKIPAGPERPAGIVMPVRRRPAARAQPAAVSPHC